MPFLGPGPRTTQTTFPVVFRNNPSSWPGLGLLTATVTLGFFWMTRLAQSDFAQETKKVQGRLDPWGLGGIERKQLAETLRVPGARDKVPPEPARPCHWEHKGHCQESDFKANCSRSFC